MNMQGTVNASEEASSSSAPNYEQPGGGLGNGNGNGASSSFPSNLLTTTSLSLSLHNHHNIIDSPKIEESDEEDLDLFTVPDVENENDASAEYSPKNTTNILQSASSINHNTTTPSSTKRSRRGRNPADRECRRLKRLLRNRVSAQQARERKKVYVNDMESRAHNLMEINSKLEEKISTLINENTMLRKLLMNTRRKVDETTDPTKDLLH